MSDQAARRLLAPAMTRPSAVWAYASASTAPGAAPVDEILCTKTSDAELDVVWVRHPGSYTGAAGHLLGDTGDGDHLIRLLRCWEHLVLELADHVELHAAQIPATDWRSRFDRMQADYLRWAAPYGLIVALGGLARDTIHDTVRDYPGGRLDHDLGDLSPDGAARIVNGAKDRPAALTPPGWDLSGWDHTRHRTHPILASLRTAPPNPPQGHTSR